MVMQLYQKLNAEGKGGLLKWYWYTAKDRPTPVDAVKTERNCHSTLLPYLVEVSGV